jgi:thioredoxin reductase
MKSYDVAIIGGGPAGLSAALVLARARRSTVVFDAGTPRNASSPGVYGFPSRDGVMPAKLKAMVRGELANYGYVDSVPSTIRRFEPHNGHSYLIEDDRGRLTRARMIILAVGMIDILPAWRGFAELWGKDIMHCAHCHGWEMRDRHWGIVANNLQRIASAHQYRAWTDSVTVFADPGLDIPTAMRSRLGDANVTLVQCRIRDLVLSSDGRLRGIRTTHGDELPCETLIYAPPQRPSGLVRSMPIKTDDNGRVVVNDRNETSLSRVFAAGDITPGPQNVLAAAAEGAAIAKKILADLVLATTASAQLRPAVNASEQYVAQTA